MVHVVEGIILGLKVRNFNKIPLKNFQTYSIKKAFQKLKKPSFKKKLLASFGVFMFFSILMASINYIGMIKLKDDTQKMVTEDVDALILYEKLRYNISQRISLVYSYLLYEDSNTRKRLEELTAESFDLEKELQQINDSEELAQILDDSNNWSNVVRYDILLLFDYGQKDVAKERLHKKAYPLAEKVIADIEQIAEQRQQQVVNKGQAVIHNSNNILVISVIISGFIVLIGLFLAFKMSNSITKPISLISQRMKAISEGGLHHEPLIYKSKDEIGELVKVINEMNNELRKIVYDITDVSEIISEKSKDLHQSSKEVKEGSKQIATTMEELSVGAETQANSASSLAEAMVVYTNKIKEIYQNGMEMEDKSNKVLAQTDIGSQLMNESMKQMEVICDEMEESVQKVQTLDQRSKDITKLVEVIQNIADQTNLLALNAAIEAARAGEFGRGFSVVAEEVRKLAEQVSHSVVDIQHIVEKVSKETEEVTKSLNKGFAQVQEGTSLIQETGAAFQNIQVHINEVSEKIQYARKELSNILENSEKMNSSITNIASLTEEAAAGIEQTSDSAKMSSHLMENVSEHVKSLSDLAEQLSGLVRKFKV